MKFDNIITINILFIFLYLLIHKLTNYYFVLNCIILLLILINQKNKPFSLLLMAFFMSSNLDISRINEGFSNKEKRDDEKENSEEEENLEEEESIKEKNKERKNKEEKNDLILNKVKEDFITKMLGDGLIQKKKKKKNKETFQINLPKYKIDTNIDKKIEQLDSAIQLFKQKIG